MGLMSGIIESAEMLGFSRVLRCWCADEMIFIFRFDII